MGEQTSFDRVIFCTNVTWKAKGYGNGKPLCTETTTHELTSRSIDLVDLNNDPHVVQGLRIQRAMADMWKTFDKHPRVHVIETIEDAVDFSRTLGTKDNKAMVFVTGSLRLVGGVLTVQETENCTV